MERLICLVLCVVGTLAFTGCKCNKNFESTSKVESHISNNIGKEYYNTYNNFENSFSNIEEENNNFIIKSSDSYAGNFYEIYDNYSNLLDKGFHDWRGSFDIYKDGDIIKLEYGFGGTGVHPKYRLYDVKNSKISRYFGGPIATYGNKVAYFNENQNKTVLVVQDAFDTKEYYKEFYGKFDGLILMKIQDINFSSDGRKIIIKYCETNNESNIIEETFDLN